MIARLIVSSCLALGALALTGGVAAAGGATPACEEGTFIGSVSGRFAANNRRFLGIDLAIAEVETIRESRFLPAGGTFPVERRYCQASVRTTDGKRRTVWYLIENNWGFAGVGSSVEFCASGLDPWHVYGANCKSLR